MTQERLETTIDAVYQGFPEALSGGLAVYRGKVRDVVEGKDKLLLVASDRLSAFDRVISLLPYKGEVLSRISAFWFRNCADIVPNHLLAAPGSPELRGTGRATLVKKAQMLPLEVVVRGYLTGSAWRDYRAGKSISGISLPEGLRFNEKFPVPLLTPSTKEASGHDRPISREEILSSGLVEPDLWAEVEKASLALFRRGQEIAGGSGLLLVDTKYEFGIIDGRLHLCDEIHTPDSSRYWWAQNYAPLFALGEAQRELDKEPFRRWLLERGFSGDGEVPAIPTAVRAETALRYIQAYETITGDLFETLAPSPQAEDEALGRIVAQALA